jgi:hypothetical protein
MSGKIKSVKNTYALYLKNIPAPYSLYRARFLDLVDLNAAKLNP